MPQELLRLLSQEPLVKRWFIDELKGKVNNPEGYPDAVVMAGQQEILVHKLVVASACPVLTKHWDPLWSASSKPIAIDESLGCEACSVHPSHGTAVLFLEYFYTGSVTWASGHAELGAALELLVMACMYDVQHLVCVAKMALQKLVENCCGVLTVADHHQAGQLRELCLHFIKQGHWMIKNCEEYRLLGEELQAEIESDI
ncbi:hypothetical protein WJX77_006047 [Trebouxia sp. C0004]